MSMLLCDQLIYIVSYHTSFHSFGTSVMSRSECVYKHFLNLILCSYMNVVIPPSLVGSVHVIAPYLAKYLINFIVTSLNTSGACWEVIR